MNQKSIVVVGADGFVGNALAHYLKAHKVVYRQPLDDEININDAHQIISEADFIINAAGFRVKPGLTFQDYRRSHLKATSALVDKIKKHAVFIHISSASVLGKSVSRIMDEKYQPRPQTFPCASYGLTKLETDTWLKEYQSKKEFKLFIIRPSVLYSPDGSGMISSILKFARKRMILCLLPQNSRHHLCEMNLLIEAVDKIIKLSDSLSNNEFLLASPYTVTSKYIRQQIQKYAKKPSILIPVPLNIISKILHIKLFSRIFSYDFVTWGDVLDIMNLNSVYDASATFKALNIDPEKYSRKDNFDILIREELKK